MLYEQLSSTVSIVSLVLFDRGLLLHDAAIAAVTAKSNGLPPFRIWTLEDRSIEKQHHHDLLLLAFDHHCRSF
jgi:hypothetical protein